MEERKHIVILAAGDFPTHPIPLRALREADFVVCCDSANTSFRPLSQPQAAASSPNLGEQSDGGSSSSPKVGEVAVQRTDGGVCKPFVVIGDGDSLSATDKAALGDRWIHVAEQDYNDLHKAMQWATQKFSILNSQFSILAATGKREDHTLGNISYLATFAHEYPGIHLEMLTDHGRFTALTPAASTVLNSQFSILNSFKGQQVSLFTLDPHTRVTATGLRWPLREAQLSPWWQGTLNEALSDTFSLSADGPFLVFQTYEPKQASVV